MVNATDSFDSDILIEGETIAAIGEDLREPAGGVDREIDAAGKLVIPGGIDPHTHLELSLG